MSEFSIKCPQCGESMKLPGRPLTALRAKCLKCGHEGRVPAADLPTAPADAPTESPATDRPARPKKRAARKTRPAEPAAAKQGRSGWGLPLFLLVAISAAGAGWYFRADILNLIAGLPVGEPSVTTTGPEAQLSSEAYAILDKHCGDCHGHGNAEGGFDLVLSSDLVDDYYVSAGNPTGSELLARMVHDDPDTRMPPSDMEQTPSDAEIEIIRHWITTGAPVDAFAATTDAVADNADPNTAPAALVEGSPQQLAQQTKAIFEQTCYRCHGESGRVEGGFNFVMNRDRLVDAGFIVPGDTSGGKLLRRMHSDSMPPRGENPRPSAEDHAVVEAWIESGAPDFNERVDRQFITTKAMFQAMEDDLLTRDEFDREFTRYFTLTHLYNADVSDEEMATYRLALAKLLNSLSRQKDLFVPQPIDAAQTILRIDLRQLKWDQDTWRHIIQADPYALQFNEADSCSTLTGCGIPSVRADWFVHKAAQPDLYHQILEIPDTLAELLDEERVDIDRNVREATALRAGFNESGVSDNNRLIERHPSTYGSFWISYDFAGNEDRQNLLSHPLGPGTEPHHFQHDGGEIIFSLPNGLQAYMLVDAKGKRINEGPIDIVKDPKQSNAHVLNGVSCMSCHYGGIIPKSDQVGPTITANRSAYEFADEILRLYRSDEVETLQQEDAERFLTSLSQIGITEATESGEPVFYMSKRFEDSLDLKLAAAELGFTDQQLLTHIAADPDVAKILGALRVPSGTVKRDRFLEQFTSMAVSLGVGTLYEGHDPGRPVDTPTTPSIPADYIAWTSTDGSKLFDGKLTAFDGIKATFETTSGAQEIQIAALSDASQEAVLKSPVGSRNTDLPLSDELDLPGTAPVSPTQAGSNEPPAFPVEVRNWKTADGNPIVEAQMVDLRDGEVYLIPGPRYWSYKNGTPELRVLHVVRVNSMANRPPSLRLRDPSNGRVDIYRLLVDFSKEDQDYISSIEHALTTGQLIDLTDPNRGYLGRYGILWKVPLKNLSQEDQDAAAELLKKLPQPPTE